MIPAALTIVGAVGLVIVHFGHDAGGDRPVPAAQPAIARVSPFAAATERTPVAAAEDRTDVERPAVAERQPESDADPADVPTAPEDFPTYDENAVQLSEEHEVPAEKSGASDANARAAAIREIDTRSSDSFPLLEQTLRSDPVARNRLLAVSSIRRLGMHPGNSDRAREALRLAMSDSDQNVSTNARDAYDELAR
jgi:hypothetical protein